MTTKQCTPLVFHIKFLHHMMAAVAETARMRGKMANLEMRLRRPWKSEADPCASMHVCSPRASCDAENLYEIREGCIIL